MIAVVSAELDALAETYALTRHSCDRDRLCEAALPLVRRVAQIVHRRLPHHFGYDDLIGDGCLGLLRAVDRFDPAYGVSFESWANRIVRGAMLNGLRRMDAVPERVRRDARMLEAARWAVAQRHGRCVSDGEAARTAHLSSSKLEAVREAAKHGAPFSIDGPPPAGDKGVPIRERLRSPALDPASVVVEASVRSVVGRAVTQLPRRERAIVRAFYGRGATFAEIGRALGVSKQRVSQLHSRAIAGLRMTLTSLSSDA